MTGGGAGHRPAPRATTSGPGRFRRWRRSCPQVVLIASDTAAVRRYLARRPPPGGEVLVLVGPGSMALLDGAALRRGDRIVWLPGWSAGPHGRDLAIAVERAAAVGLFGTARHVFAVDA